MSGISQRAFSRNYYPGPIMYADHKSKNYHRAKMLNCSVGGMYFESNEKLCPGANIHIKITDFSPDPYWPEANDNFLAEVRWCKKKEGNDTCSYSVGVRFILDKCKNCGKQINHNDINDSELCPDCYAKIKGLKDDKVKHCIENYLFGNVL